MNDARDTFIGEILVERNVVSPEQMDQLMSQRAEKGGSLVDLLTSSEAVDETKLWQTVAEEMDLEFEEKLVTDDIEPHLIAELPIVFAKSNHVLPLGETTDGVRVACANPFDI